MELFLNAGLTLGSHTPEASFECVGPRALFFSLGLRLCLCVSCCLSFCLLATNALALTPLSHSGLLPLFLGPCLSLFLPLRSSSLSLFLLWGSQFISQSVFVLSLTISAPLSVCLSVSAFSVSLSVCPHLCHSYSLPSHASVPQASPLLPSESLWPLWKGYCKRE